MGHIHFGEIAYEFHWTSTMNDLIHHGNEAKQTKRLHLSIESNYNIALRFCFVFMNSNNRRWPTTKTNSNYCLAHTNCERNGKQPKLTNDQQRLHFVFHQLCSHSNWMTSSLAKCIGNERNHHTHTHVNREEFNWASTKPELIRKHKHTHTYTWTQARYGVCSVHVSHGHSTPSRQNNRMNVERTVRISYSK